MRENRLMTRAEAAAYCHLSPSGFSDWITKGRLPPPLEGTRRWDRHALDFALDQLSGIERPEGRYDPEKDPEAIYEAWKRENG